MTRAFALALALVSPLASATVTETIPRPITPNVRVVFITHERIRCVVFVNENDRLIGTPICQFEPERAPLPREPAQ